MSIFNSSIIAREQHIPLVAQAQHMSHLQYFLRHDTLQAFFCKLGRQLYLKWYYMISIRMQLKNNYTWFSPCVITILDY